MSRAQPAAANQAGRSEPLVGGGGGGGGDFVHWRAPAAGTDFERELEGEGSSSGSGSGSGSGSAHASIPAAGQGSEPAGPSGGRAAPTPATPKDSKFLRQRLAAAAALPAEQRDHDEAAFLRGYGLLQLAQQELGELEGLPPGGARGAGLQMCAHAYLGYLEALASIGVDLNLLLVDSHDLLMAVGKLDAEWFTPAMASHPCRPMGMVLTGFVATFANLRSAQSAHNIAAHLDSIRRELWETPLIELRLQVLTEIGEQIHHAGLPSLRRLRCLWATLAYKCGYCYCYGAQASGAAGHHGPSREQAYALMKVAASAMQQLQPEHPVSDRLQAQMHGITATGGNCRNILRRGLQHAAAVRSSYWTAELSYGLVENSLPSCGSPPWGHLSLAEAQQLLRQADEAYLRCKASLPHLFIESLRPMRRLPAVLWTRAAVESHVQAGAAEWRVELLPPVPEPAARGSVAVMMTKQYRECAGCGTQGVELRMCSGCRLPDVLYCSRACQTSHWKVHKPQCKQAQGRARQPEQAGASR